MKKYKTTIIALILIAVVIGGYFLSRSLGLLHPEEEATPTPTPSGVVVFPFAEETDGTDRIVRIECISAQYDVVLEKKGGEWSCPSYETLALVSNRVTGLLNTLRSTRGQKIHEGPVTADVQRDFGFLDGYGSVTVTMQDGTEYYALFGKTSTNGSYRYLWLQGTETVYMVTDTVWENLMISPMDLISGKLFTFSDSGQINRITVMRGGVEQIRMQATLSSEEGATRTWNVLTPLQREGDATTIESLLSMILSLQAQDVEALGCEDLAQYELDPPSYSVAVSDPWQTVTLHLGRKTADGAYYYATVDDSRDVYLLSASSVNFKDEQPLSYMSKYVYMTMYTNLTRIDLELEARTYRLDFTFTEDDETLYFNGHNVNQPDNDCRRAMKRIDTALYNLSIVALEDEPAEPGRTLCTVKYSLQDGTEHTVVCTERDVSTMYFYLDGAYVGGYGNRYQLTGPNENYGIQGTIDNLTALLGFPEE